MKLTLEQIVLLESLIFNLNKKLVSEVKDWRKVNGFFQHADKHTYKDTEELDKMKEEHVDLVNEFNIAEDKTKKMQLNAQIKALREDMQELLKKEYNLKPDKEHLHAIRIMVDKFENLGEIDRKVIAKLLDCLEEKKEEVKEEVKA